MWRIECGKQREPGRDEIGSMGHEQATSSGDDGAHPGQCVVVAPRDLEDREPPDAPPGMTLSRALRQVFIEQRVRAETHDHQQAGHGLVAEVETLEHDRRLRTGPDRQRPHLASTSRHHESHGTGTLIGPSCPVFFTHVGSCSPGAPTIQRRGCPRSHTRHGPIVARLLAQRNETTAPMTIATSSAPGPRTQHRRSPDHLGDSER